MTKEENFEQLYQKIVDENADYMETLRKEADHENKENKLIQVIIIISNIIINFLLYAFFDVKTFKGLPYITVFFILLSFIMYSAIKSRNGKSKIDNYKKDFKTRIVDNIIKSFNKGFKFIPSIGLSETIYREAEFENYDRYNSEDLIQGTLNNGCAFVMSEVLTEERYEDSNDNVKYSTIFRGLVAKIEIPKEFNTLIYLRRDVKTQNFIRRIFPKKLSFKDMRLVLDSKEFEDIFDVYASDKNIGMQLFTEDIMQMLLNFKNEMQMMYEITIKNNELYIRIWCGEMFETAKLKKFSLDKDTLYKYYKMLDFTFELIDELINLLNKI